LASPKHAPYKIARRTTPIPPLLLGRGIVNSPICTGVRAIELDYWSAASHTAKTSPWLSGLIGRMCIVTHQLIERIDSFASTHQYSLALPIRNFAAQRS